MKFSVIWTLWLRGPGQQEGTHQLVQRPGQMVIECESPAEACAEAVGRIDDALALEFSMKAAAGEKWSLGSMVMSAVDAEVQAELQAQGQSQSMSVEARKVS